MNFKKLVLKIVCVIISMTYLNSRILNGKLYENVLTFDISQKTLIGAKPLRIRFDKVDGFIRVYDGNRYLVLFGLEKYDTTFNRNRYLIGLKRGITDQRKIDSYDSLHLERY